MALLGVDQCMKPLKPGTVARERLTEHSYKSAPVDDDDDEYKDEAGGPLPRTGA